MDQVNLLAFLFSTQVMDSQQQGTASTAECEAGEMDFLMTLNQTLWSGKLPMSLQLQDQGAEYAGEAETWLASMQSAETSSASVLEMLLELLAENLKTLIAESAALTEDSTSTAENSTLLDVESSLQAIVSGTTEETTGEVTQNTGAVELLLAAWQNLAARLGSLVINQNGAAADSKPTGSALYTLVPWQPQIVTDTTGATAMPWSTAEYAAGMAELAGGVGTGIGVDAFSDTELLSSLQDYMSAPASIRWFASGGQLPEGDNQELVQAVPVQIESDTVELPDGSPLKVTVQELPQNTIGLNAADGSVVRPTGSYSVLLQLQGDENAALSARLDVVRIGENLLPSAPVDGIEILPPYSTEDVEVDIQESPAVFPVKPSGIPGAASVISDEWRGQVLPETSGIAFGQELTAPEQPIQVGTVSGAAGTSGQALAVNSDGKDAQVLAPDVAVRTPVEVPITVQPAGGEEPTVRVQQNVSAGNLAAEVAVKTTQPVATSVGLQNGNSQNFQDIPMIFSEKTTEAAEQIEFDTLMEQLFKPANLASPGTGLDESLFKSLEGLVRSNTAVQDSASPVATAASVDSLPAQLMQFTDSTMEIKPYIDLNSVELAERLLEQVSAARQGGDGLYNARLSLNPPSLGQMYVNIFVRGDNVSMQIGIASSAPKELLKDSLEALEQSLEDSGMNVVELRVMTIDSDREDSGSRNRGRESGSEDEAQSEDETVKQAPVLETTLKSTPAMF